MSTVGRKSYKKTHFGCDPEKALQIHAFSCYCLFLPVRKQSNPDMKPETLQQNILLNNRTMLRHKKIQVQRLSVNRPLNISLCQNFESEVQPKSCKAATSYPRTSKDMENRLCLRQIETNVNLSREFGEDAAGLKNKFSLSVGRNMPMAKAKEQHPIFDKIVQLIKNQELRMPFCPLSLSKQRSGAKARPSTSLSLHTRKSLSQSNACQGELVLDASNVNESIVWQPRKISTSRALMHYSKVYRNASGQRFKVRRDRSLYRNSVHLEAQKMVLQQKQKRQKCLISKSIEKAVFVQQIDKTRANKRKDRYADQQQFELGGWEYFQ